MFYMFWSTILFGVSLKGKVIWFQDSSDNAKKSSTILLAQKNKYAVCCMLPTTQEEKSSLDLKHPGINNTHSIHKSVITYYFWNEILFNECQQEFNPYISLKNVSSIWINIFSS